MSSSGKDQFQLSYQISPIILTNGIAANVSGGIPIVSLTNSDLFNDGLLSSGSADRSLDDYFAQFVVLAGGTLIDNQLGKYPFANQQVASNAVITQPLTVSVRMICPVREAGGYSAKLATITALRSSFADHVNSGGTYTVATPFYTYLDGILLSMRDVSGGESKQAQYAWQLDFEFPLLTLEAANEAQSALMSKISSGAEVPGDPPAWSGLSATIGNPSTLATPSVVPAASGAAGAGVSAPFPSGTFARGGTP
jgi:hypothetical protein